MKFSDEQLKSFIALYKREFGETLDRAEAERQAVALVGMVKLTYFPMTRKDYIYYGNLAKSDDCGKLSVKPNRKTL